MESAFSSFDIITSFLIASSGIFCLLFALIQALSNRSHELIHYIHSGFFFALGICILSDPVSRQGTEWLAPALLYVNYPLDYLLPVLLYFYFILVFEDHITLGRRHLLLLLPSIAVTGAFMPFFLLSSEEKLGIYPLSHHSWGYLSPLSQYIDYGIFMWMLFCMILTLKAISLYLFDNRKHIKSVFLFLVAGGILAASLIYSNFTEHNLHYKINMLVMVVLLVILAAMTVRNPDFYLKVRRKSSEIRYNRSQLETLNVDGVMDRINDLMAMEHLYRDPELSIGTLSNILNITGRQLSEIINSRYGQNFSSFLNSYRLEAVKQELRNDPDSTILVIAMNCGFNSKSTFNKVFQESEGMTPSQWRKSMADNSRKGKGVRTPGRTSG